MKDLLNKAITAFADLGKTRIIILSVTAMSLMAAVPVSYVAIKKSEARRKNNETKIDADTPSSNTSDELINGINGGDNFAMQDEFFGSPGQTPQFDPNANSVSNDHQMSNTTGQLPNRQMVKSEEFIPVPQKPDRKKQLIKDISLERNSKSDIQIINYDEPDANKGNVLELLADADYPKTIASKPYDLDRVLTTDMFIPAVMYTAVNSEIPSKTVLAKVESDVTGFHGRNILIPAGSTVEGVFERLDSKHARRMQISWFKITRPDGIIIKLESESADSHGASGVTGYLDQRLKDRYGGALLLSSINTLAQMSVRDGNIRDLAAAESFGREAGNLTAQIIRENINIMPIITIEQGQRFNIRPYKNIYFREPVNTTANVFFTNS